MTTEAKQNDPWARTRNGKPVVGAIARRKYTVTQADTDAWARISQDFNPLHFDEAAAKESIFGERVGHGGVMQAVLHGLLATEVPGPGTVFLNSEMRFQKPVRIDETIEGEVEVLEVRDDKPICKMALKVTRSDGLVCLSGTGLLFTSHLG
ncbi:acyl dehydratase [Variovorax sp. WS11]|uniref:MaoC family dehydratase n=1 Tax=Variovorax sp. WS11 TaxID=1105204 RepID=UPI000D0D3731|nr:MaoC family dehydratase [Variovorax sp. WS11]NDZ12762.1 MaoC family dehydratase [Variovorax sp. WS11]PSL84698.1 acyl dehydratase [Variovorax sp. WS11]